MTKIGSASTVAITGDLRGRLVNCVLRPDSNELPAPGKYHLSKPVSDPIYGQVATMSPSDNTTATDDWENTGNTAVAQDNWSLYVGTGLTTDTSALSSILRNAGPQASATDMFILADRPVPGRLSLVLSMGFAELMDALDNTGGALLTVS